MSDIAGQDYPAELFEVIVVDDNSSDSTFEIASGFTEIKNLKSSTIKGKEKRRQ